MSGEFTVRITLGNAEMQDVHNVAHALKRLADRIEYGVDCELRRPGYITTGVIHDINGNTVGEWRAETEHDDETN